MSIQSALNNAAFEQLPETYKAIKKAKDGHIRGTMEQYALNKIMNCTPCLDDMSEEQKIRLDEKIVLGFIERELLVY